MKMTQTIEVGVILFETDGFATAIPPTALVTDMAGVNIPLAIIKLVPKRDWKDGC